MLSLLREECASGGNCCHVFMFPTHRNGRRGNHLLIVDKAHQQVPTIGLQASWVMWFMQESHVLITTPPDDIVLANQTLTGGICFPSNQQGVLNGEILQSIMCTWKWNFHIRECLDSLNAHFEKITYAFISMHVPHLEKQWGALGEGGMEESSRLISQACFQLQS